MPETGGGELSGVHPVLEALRARRRVLGRLRIRAGLRHLSEVEQHHVLR